MKAFSRVSRATKHPQSVSNFTPNFEVLEADMKYNVTAGAINSPNRLDKPK